MPHPTITYKRMQAILLAGGKSSKFNTGKSKLIEKICGKEMILYPIDLLRKLDIPLTLVSGHHQEAVLNVLSHHNINDISLFQDTELLGTGKAVALTKSLWTHDHILIMHADMPLVDEHVITKLYKKHINTDADITFITSHAPAPDFENDAYYKIVINDNKINVIEPQDYKAESENTCCISAGMFLVKRSFLEKHIHELTVSKLTGKYYFPEIIQIASNNNAKIVSTPFSFDIMRSISNLEELWVIEHIKRAHLIKHWMKSGVRFAHTLNVMIDVDVTIEQGAYISAGAHLLGKTSIKKDANIGAFAFIKNSVIGQHAKIKSHTVIRNSIIGDHAIIQPFSHIHDQNIHATPKNSTKRFSPLFTGAIRTDTHEL